VPLYLSESAPTRIRGAVTTLNQVFHRLGFFLAYLADLLLSSSGAWRWMIGLAVIPGVLPPSALRSAESPRCWCATPLDEAARSSAAHADRRCEAELAEIERGAASRNEATFASCCGPLGATALVAACG